MGTCLKRGINITSSIDRNYLKVKEDYYLMDIKFNVTIKIVFINSAIFVIKKERH